MNEIIVNLARELLQDEYHITNFIIIDITLNRKEQEWNIKYINGDTGDLCQLDVKVHTKIKF